MNDDIPTMTSEELRAIRTEMALTQAEMAKRMGMTFRGYQAWEGTKGKGGREIPGPAVLLARRLFADHKSRK